MRGGGGAGATPRQQFFADVMGRDQGRCVACGSPAQDAHHLIERRLFPDGGYHVDNGVALCGTCHRRAEDTSLEVEALRSAARIGSVVLPPQLCADARYDKWGNELVIVDGDLVRLPGELYLSAELDRVLGAVRSTFRTWIRWPQIPRLEPAPSRHSGVGTSPGPAAAPPRRDSRHPAELLETLPLVLTTGPPASSRRVTITGDRIYGSHVHDVAGLSRDPGKLRGVMEDLPFGWRWCGYLSDDGKFTAEFLIDQHRGLLSIEDTCTFAELSGIGCLGSVVTVSGIDVLEAVAHTGEAGGGVVRPAGPVPVPSIWTQVARIRRSP